jgi:tetratricopeptide (TPR) repeat protein
MTAIVNVIQNSYACYMKLGHFKEALKCADYIKQLMPDYLKTYLLYGLIPYFNKAASLRDLRKGLSTVKEGLAITGLATANSQSFLPLLKSLEKSRDLLENKIRTMI